MSDDRLFEVSTEGTASGRTASARQRKPTPTSSAKQMLVSATFLVIARPDEHPATSGHGRHVPEADRALRYPPSFTTPAIFVSVCFASPNTIIVLGFANSSFSIPANPAAMLRLSTITAFDWSAFRIGIP